jgi:phosphopantothenoylcysteine decarboxylase
MRWNGSTRSVVVANVLLGVTGSVAAILTPALVERLRNSGHQVRVVATQASLYFFDPAGITPPPQGEGEPMRSTPAPPLLAGEGVGGRGDRQRDPAVVSLDADEWPGRDDGRRWQRNDEVLHIELRRWADLFLIAPLDANTLAKLAAGLADNCLTCVWRAWDPARPVVLAPAMNTLMWQHPLTRRHFYQLATDNSDREIPAGLDLDALLAWINANCRRLRVVPPQSKRLACGDVGVGAMASLEQVVGMMESFPNWKETPVIRAVTPPPNPLPQRERGSQMGSPSQGGSSIQGSPPLPLGEG